MHDLENLLAAIIHTHDTKELENIGKQLSGGQFLNLLNEAEKHPHDYHKKLSPILVGLSPKVFEQSLTFIRATHLEALKREATAEPLQHQLTLFVHEQEGGWESISIIMEKLFRTVEQLNVDHITRQHLNDIMSEAIATTTSIHHRIENIGIALALAWNTSRVDLVDRLSILKERFLNVENLKEQVEYWLKNHLEAVFGNPEKQEEVDAVSNNDPAIEGLAKFSLWYPEDYWEIGLLPQIIKKEELFPEIEHSREERTKELMEMVVSNLKELGLSTVADLKKHQIYSKEFLQEFIVERW